MKNFKEKVYQLFITGFEGENPPEKLLEILNNGLGGVIFFTKNIKTIEQTKILTNIIRNNSLYTPFLCIDEEGGRVERTENLFNGKKFLSAKFIAEKGEIFVIKQTKEISDLLKNLGFNLNFAPVLDVNTNPDNPIIGERAFSDKTDEVIKFGNIVVKEYLNNGIIPCTKHFPGHGDANTDSHLTLPEINLDFDDFKQNHIRAFKEVTSPMVMVAHLHCKAFDKDVIPSSISENVLSYLKKELKYNPLIITDDMIMGGIVQKNSPVDNVVSAIKNGVNIILYRNCDKYTIDIIDGVYEAALKDIDLKNKIEQSFDKIIEFKQKYLSNL